MKYEEIKVGLTAKLNHLICQKDIADFVELTGDDNKLHVDSNYAANTSFGKPVAHGMLGASFISTVIGTKIPGDGALWFSQTLDFILPVREGDHIQIVAEVLAKNDRDRTIELSTKIFNQHKQLVTDGIARVKVIDQVKPYEKSEPNIQDQKVAIVVGGSGGIGSATSIALAKAGYEVVITYVGNKERALTVQEQLMTLGAKVTAVQCDITDENSILAMMEKVLRVHQTVTAVVNCATSKIAAIKFDNLDWGDYVAHLDNQIKGNFQLVKAVLPIMEKNGYGKIVFLNSQELDTPSSGWIPYVTGKGALAGFAKALALELSKKGVRVNSVSPGMTQTDQIADVPERIRLMVAAKTPLGRLATPQDVAEAILFLVSERSDFLCGETIRVNGGSAIL
jgi:3-oxoacyl-[acyl-carrier protein] reductase